MEGDFKTILYHAIVSTILKWQTFKLLGWIQNLHLSVWAHKVLYAHTSSKDE
jgi:hypothetical protein